ncbi:MAG: HAD-IIB family hydrolase [Acidobacteria bacterium]|nr:HAD-IIB family hydrolase [Acidobacteriota bacterium]
MKKLVVFDLDGTLAESKSSISSQMACLLHELLGVLKVAVISGGSWAQFEGQLLASLPSQQRFAGLFLLPTCGTQFFRYDGDWVKVYSEELSAAQRRRIIASLERALVESGTEVDQVWGDAIEDRGSQITLSVLGQEAPLSAKQDWDRDFAKRRKITAILEPLLPTFAINMGGTTSIDVTQRGVDKAYGIHKLEERLDLTLAEMLFVGDALFEGGNDYPVQEIGVDSIQVRDPNETAHVIQTVIACLGDGANQVLSAGTTS